MKTIWLSMITFMLMGVMTIQAVAQQRYIRPEDHFWRKRVVQRISLIEKINAPLVYHESSYYNGDNSTFKERNGIVVSLINGAGEGKYSAIHPDTGEPMTYAALQQRIVEFEQLLTGPGESWEETEGEPEFEDEFAVDAFTAEPDSDEWEFEEWEDPDATLAAVEPTASTVETITDFGSFEQVIHLVEDWIFDKTTAAMVHQLQFFELIWVDPSGILPERVLCRFKWEEVEEQMENTQWKNRFNDIETRTLKEIFALRLFNGIMIDVGGQPVRTIWEAENRRREIVEFEHHLWSY